MSIDVLLCLCIGMLMYCVLAAVVFVGAEGIQMPHNSHPPLDCAIQAIKQLASWINLCLK